MADLSTKYMGLSLSNPFIVASSSLTKSVDGIRKCADAGAGAVVLKSLFEEQIAVQAKDMEENLWLYGHTEAFEYVSKMAMPLGPRAYLQLIEGAKAAVKIPVIASLNCITPRWWADFARQIEGAGADALELNISVMPSDPERTSEDIEQIYLDIVESLEGSIRIPLAVKIGPYFTSVARMAREFSTRGVSALVLFNRFYQIDFDTEKIGIVPGLRFSSPDEISLPLRWIALLAGNVDCDLAASTGVHDGTGLVKQLLAGATAVQVCSVLYEKGIDYISTIIGEVEAWMKAHGFERIEDFRGMLSREVTERPELYERLQYIKLFVGIE
jgi:dihydroorotate dehydrogenase (fumarate)